MEAKAPNALTHCCACAQDEDDTSIVVGLAQCATEIVNHGDKVPDELKTRAQAYLDAWFKRKMPSLEMPKF